ncbi:prenyltransferase/squalene oxidase repeat-containing protein [Actinomadura mexicana]|uniref:Prenyltransferase and squalene oxidase repeat-containing protein n=1 Tax=Actinomadura mexicana TaxID=134959 RepID=A0A239FR87_9ACTN|nr:prenyltransferase/squalene oxidase repeat-containing protein [Actinomadura mexicana]SNS59360.1 Prenyltransferase and squalene oxidase repeat-containing protein [Actinomadura mexicana]
MNQTPPLPSRAPRAPRVARSAAWRRGADDPVIDLAVLDARLNESLDVLRDTYSPALGAGGGWYHELARPEPGTTATALGLMAFAEAGRAFEHFDDGLELLAARQTRSDDPLRDGGWATRTSLGMPVVEATGWIARFLGRARCDLREDAPDLERAYRWLLYNQNPDGGWGSLHGCPSRVWLTCLALRALSQLNPYDPAVDRGVEWLTADRTARRPAWGPTQASRPTVTHTAFALATLAEARPDLRTERLVDAYDWLLEHFDPDDDHTWIETYGVSPPTVAERGTGPEPVWRLALWHYGLPIALTALLRDPRGPHGPTVARAFRTLVRGEVADPRWNGYPGSGRTSLWTLWWRLETLVALSRTPLAGNADVLHWLPDAMVVQRAHARERPLADLLPHRRLVDPVGLARRHWAAFLLSLVCAGSALGVAAGMWGWKDFWLSVILPILLTSIDESVKRRRAQRAPP